MFKKNADLVEEVTPKEQVGTTSSNQIELGQPVFFFNSSDLVEIMVYGSCGEMIYLHLRSNQLHTILDFYGGLKIPHSSSAASSLFD